MERAQLVSKETVTGSFFDIPLGISIGLGNLVVTSVFLHLTFSDFSFLASRGVSFRFFVESALAGGSAKSNDATRVSATIAALLLIALILLQTNMYFYSHSIVAGGFEVISRITRLTSRTSLVMRFEIFARTS